MMNRNGTTAILLVLCFAFGAAGAADLQGQIKPGLYEITTSIEASGIEGMPGGMKMPGTTVQHCISKKDVDDASQGIFLQQGAMGQMPKDCAVQNFNLSGNTATYKMACTGASKMALEGSASFNGTGYHGVNTMTMVQGNGQISMKISFDSRYLGACTP